MKAVILEPYDYAAVNIAPIVASRCSPNSPKTFTMGHTNGLLTLLGETYIGYGCLLPEILVFPTLLIIWATGKIRKGERDLKTTLSKQEFSKSRFGMCLILKILQPFCRACKNE